MTTTFCFEMPEPLHHVYIADLDQLAAAVKGCTTAGLATLILPEQGMDGSHHLHIYNPETLEGLI